MGRQGCRCRDGRAAGVGTAGCLVVRAGTALSPTGARQVSVHPIPPEGAARLTANLEAFLRSAQQACESPAAKPSEVTRWHRATSLLQRDLAAVRDAAAKAAGGQQEDLVAQASRLRFLARQMDGYDLAFAGPEFAQRLEQQRRLTVLVAWQVFAAGTGSGASGL